MPDSAQPDFCTCYGHKLNGSNRCRDCGAEQRPGAELRPRTQAGELHVFAQRIARLNDANGWTIDVNDRSALGLKVALVASEAVEFCEEYERRSEPNLNERLATELADVAIRVLHLAHALDIRDLLVDEIFVAGVPAAPTVATQVDFRTPYTVRAAIMQRLVMPAFRAFEALRTPGSLDEIKPKLAAQFAVILFECESLADELHEVVKLADAIDAKLEKNAKRGVRYGGKHF